MKQLEPRETELVGEWIWSNGKMTADETCRRIQWLVSTRLEELQVNSEAWTVLLRDPADGRHWELGYPQSHLHGGGPPTLRHLRADELEAKYGL